MDIFLSKYLSILIAIAGISVLPTTSANNALAITSDFNQGYTDGHNQGIVDGMDKSSSQKSSLEPKNDIFSKYNTCLSQLKSHTSFNSTDHMDNLVSKLLTGTSGSTDDYCNGYKKGYESSVNMFPSFPSPNH